MVCLRLPPGIDDIIHFVHLLLSPYASGFAGLRNGGDRIVPIGTIENGHNIALLLQPLEDAGTHANGDRGARSVRMLEHRNILAVPLDITAVDRIVHSFEPIQDAVFLGHLEQGVIISSLTDRFHHALHSLVHNLYFLSALSRCAYL